MFITVDILQKRGACQEYLDFFASHFPDGVEMMQMIEQGHLSYHALHWGYKWLDPNEEEVAAYWKRVRVENSEGVDESDHITNSKIISHSSEVIESEEVYHSKNVNTSCYITHSEDVEHSQDVGNSNFVWDSGQVLNSSNITNSTEVFESTYVVNSDGIFRSSNIMECMAIINSHNLTDCGYCADCKNLKNALFCQGIADGEYMLFNKPIDKARFEVIYKQFKKFSPRIQLTEPWKRIYGQTPRVNYNYRKHHAGISIGFWRWVRTLPNFDPMTMYSITFDPQFLH